MVIETNETREKIIELLNELKFQKNDFENSLKIWNNIMALDLSGGYSEMYMEEFSKFLNEREYRDLELARRFGEISIRVYADANQYAALQTFDYLLFQHQYK